MASCLDALAKPRPDIAPGLPVLLVAAICLVDKDGRILLARRPEGKHMAGLWEFPGGKVQAGETPEFALCREMEEELDLQVRECCLSPLGFASHSYDKFHLMMPLYACRMWQGTPVPQEGQELAWVKPGELASYDMPPADIPLIYQIIDRI